MEMFHCPLFQWGVVLHMQISAGDFGLSMGCKGLLCFVIGNDLFHHLCQMLLILISDSELSVTISKILSFHLFQRIHKQLSIVLCCYGKWDNLIFCLQERRNKKFKIANLKKWKRTETSLGFLKLSGLQMNIAPLRHFFFLMSSKVDH